MQCINAMVGGDAPGATGSLTLQSGARMACSGNMSVGGIAADGLVEIGQNSQLEIDGGLDVGGPNPGTVRLLDATSLLRVSNVTVVNNDGRVEGTGTFDSARIRNGNGFISPGLSPVTLTIEGDYEQQEGGTLVMEVAGLEPGQFDVLKVTGAATSGGKLEVRFLDGFQPQAGDVMEFVQADGGITGSFAETTFPDAPPGL